MFTRIESNAVVEERVIVRPGLTANGNPTSDVDESVPWEEINFEDDWGVIKIITTDADYE
jgi:hypothetical protein